MDIVMLDDIFDIVTFIHPSTMQLLLNNGTMLQKYTFIKKKTLKRRFWVESRHHLFYIWHFFGYRALPEEYPSSCDPMDIQYHVPRWFLWQKTAFISNKPRKQQCKNSTIASGPLIYLNYFPLLKLNNKPREMLQN